MVFTPLPEYKSLTSLLVYIQQAMKTVGYEGRYARTMRWPHLFDHLQPLLLPSASPLASAEEINTT